MQCKSAFGLLTGGYSKQVYRRKPTIATPKVHEEDKKVDHKGAEDIDQDVGEEEGCVPGHSVGSREDGLGDGIRATQVVQILTHERNKKLVNFFENQASWQSYHLFRGHVDVHVDVYRNRRNSTSIVIIVEDCHDSVRYGNRTKSAAKSMVFTAVGSDGQRLPLIWIYGSLGPRGYLEIIKKSRNVVFQRNPGSQKYLMEKLRSGTFRSRRCPLRTR